MVKLWWILPLIVFAILLTYIPTTFAGASSGGLDLPGLPDEGSVTPPLRKIEPSLLVKEGRLRVVVECKGYCNSSELRRAGLRIEVQTPYLVQGTIDARDLPLLDSLDSVLFVRRPLPVFPAEVSEGVRLLDADELQGLGVLGDDVDVAVIDVGFYPDEPEIASRVVEVVSFRSDGVVTPDNTVYARHGTANAEIILDMAPNARLHLYVVSTDAELIEAIDYASTKCKIASISLSVLGNGWYDGSSPASRAVDEARSRGMLPVVAAGNWAQSHWSGIFTDSDNDRLHEFKPKVELNSFYLYEGAEAFLVLSWDDPWGASSNDFDLYVLDSSFSIIASSTIPQTGSQPPVEYIEFTPPYTGIYYVVIKRKSASRNVYFHLFVNGRLDIYVEEGSIPNLADAKGAFTVGAINVFTGEIEPYSSRGPTADGRIKPDIVAPDGVSTASYGPRNYYGTSAATPHVAGLAALIMGNSSLIADEVQTFIERNAIDLGSPGPDNVHGWGRARAAFVAVDVSPPKIRPYFEVIVDERRYEGAPLVFFWLPETSHSIRAERLIVSWGTARYIFGSWNQAVGSAQMRFTYGGGKIYYTAYYTLQYLLTVELKLPAQLNVTINGVSAIYEGPNVHVWVNESSSVSLVPVNPFYYHGNGTRSVFKGWDEPGNPLVLKFTMDGSKYVKALWGWQYLVTVDADPIGVELSVGLAEPVEVSHFEEWIDAGVRLAIEVPTTTVDYGNGTRWVFVGWRGDVHGNATRIEVVVQRPFKVEAEWSKQFLVSLIFYDSVGRPLKPSRVILDGRTLDNYTGVWLDAGDHVLGKVLWAGFEVTPQSQNHTFNVASPGDLRLFLEVYDIRLVVKNAIFGLPVPWASVEVVLGNGTVIRGSTDASGTFLIRRVPRSLVEIRVWSGFEARSPRIIVAGNRDVVIGTIFDLTLLLVLVVATLLSGLAAYVIWRKYLSQPASS